MDRICTFPDGGCQARLHVTRLLLTHATNSTLASKLIVDDWPNTHYHAHKMDFPLRHRAIRTWIPVLCRGADHELLVIDSPLGHC